MMKEAIETFKIEAREHLELLESVLLELEEHPDDGELIAQAFRSMHTIKGSGGMFGYETLSDFTHHLETAFDKIRNGDFSITPAIISVVLDSKDYIDGLLESTQASEQQIEQGDRLLERLTECLPNNTLDAGIADGAGETDKTVNNDCTLQATEPDRDQPKSYRIILRPNATAFTDGLDPTAILRELRALSTHCVIRTMTDQVAGLNAQDAEVCRLAFDVWIETEVVRREIDDVFIFVEDDWDIDIQEGDLEDTADHDIPLDRDERQTSGVPLSSEDNTECGGVSGSLGDNNAVIAANESQNIHSPEFNQQASSISQPSELKRSEPSEKSEKSKQAADTTVRVPATKLDNLMDLVGELVIVQARMKQLADNARNDQLVSISEDLDRLTTELRDNAFDIRMLPIGTTFSRFRRLVRDLSNSLGKEISLITEGAETELDKMVIDRLADPMVHLIRNSIDHGIELPEERERAGKPSQGTVRLTASHQESHVVITIQDDGKGMDPEKIRQIAIEKGVIKADTVLTKEACYELIFEPGFSTAKAVTDISGRGVGMDVVRRSIEALRGQISIASELGQGTVMTIRLPMTLAIIEGLMVSVSEERYVLPLNCVEECIEYVRGSREQNKTSAETLLIDIRGELVPFVRLREWFSVPGLSTEIEQIVVVRQGDDRFGFCVDEVIGQYQTVIKSLGSAFPLSAGLAGATIMGNGGVAMVLDVNQLVSAVHQQETVALVAK